MHTPGIQILWRHFLRESFWGQNDEQCNVFSNVNLIYAHHLKPSNLWSTSLWLQQVHQTFCRRAVWKEELSSKTVLKDSLTYNHQQHHHHPKHHHPHHHQTPLTPNGSYTKHHLHQTSFFTKHLFDTTHFPSLSGRIFCSHQAVRLEVARAWEARNSRCPRWSCYWKTRRSWYHALTNPLAANQCQGKPGNHDRMSSQNIEEIYDEQWLV